MKRGRLAVHAITGLLFLVQGFAVSAAMLPRADSAPPGTAMSMMDMDMPCHHATSPDAPKPRCCEPGCLGAAACASATVAIAASAPMLPAAAPEHFVAPERAIVLPPPRIALHLRPPIALHG